MSAQTVVDKIEQLAANEAADIISKGQHDAQRLADDIIENARKNAAEKIQTAESEAAALAVREEQKAYLTARINTLNTKKAIIKETRERCLTALNKMSDAEWEAFYTPLVLKSGMSGKISVLASVADAKRITDLKLCEKWALLIEKAREAKCTVTLDKNAGTFSGGIVLQCAAYDIDLSFDSLLDDCFDKKEREIAEMIF